MTDVRAMRPEDWPAVHAIYAEGIATGHAAFEAAQPDWEHFDAGRLKDHRLLAVVDGQVLGWAAVSAVSTRPVYAGVVEHSVYVARAARGRGLGHALLAALIGSTERTGIWTVQSSVFPENTASLALHAAYGFKQFGRRERIAKMTYGPQVGEWRDTITLERRSALTGT